jgi:thymidylate synthase
MQVIRGLGVNELYHCGMRMLREHGVTEDSRNGKVLVMPCPVTSVYEWPTQRVLLDPARAANPFFHLFESLWMLAGRDDVAALNTYITDFGTRFAEKDGRVHGAYGHRWRNAFGFDQLDAIVNRLRGNPQDRQCVLQMWDCASVAAPDDPAEHIMGSNDLNGDWKDRPCNTQAYFRVRKRPTIRGGEVTHDTVLDMTITCRSNDIVYGAYGANAVHFSILQEYVAGRIGAKVGAMYQISNNYHAYLDVLERVGSPTLTSYSDAWMKPLPMATDWDAWDEDLHLFMQWQQALIEQGKTEPASGYHNSWFANTAEPMFLAHFQFKHAMKMEAQSTAQIIEAEDWRAASLQWLRSRNNPRSR